MRRFFGLLVVIFFALPLGLSMAGCGHAAAVSYCNGSGYGPTTGQVQLITLASTLAATGESLNYGQIASALSASAQDCNGGAVTVNAFTYATTNMQIADVNPSTGSVCGGTWNRNTGGGIADYTICTAPTGTVSSHTAYITASAAGAVSNPIEVFTHAPVTGIELASAATPNCSTTTDPGSDCCSFSTNGTTTAGTVYNPSSCISQNDKAQLVARVYSNGTTNPADNITCQVGHIAYALQTNTSVATIDATGVITADQPGSALVTATVSNSASAVNAGFLSTCPPVSIALTAVGQSSTATSANVAINTPQGFTTTIKDKNNVTLTGLALTFNSTLPVNIPASSSTVTAAYPGTAIITATCQPPTCNPSPFSQTGYLGNGVPASSNGFTVTATGTASNVLYMGSTNSQYVASEDFTTGQLSPPIKLPYTPNSMVISQDGTTLYMGSSGGLMTVTTASNALSAAYQTIQGMVLSVAPNNSYAVMTDPTRQTVSLVTSSGTVYSSFNGVGTRAVWSPDSSTLYVTTNTDALLTYSTAYGWQTTTSGQTAPYTDVALTVPYIGAYFGGAATDIRSYCPYTASSTSATPPTTSEVFTPLAAQVAATTDRLAATYDGAHVIGVTAGGGAPVLNDVTVAYPATATQPNGPGVCTSLTTAAAVTANTTPHPFAASNSTAGISLTGITGVYAAANTDLALVTYTGTGGVLPVYLPATGALSGITLSGGATTAPIAGVFSTDSSTFYAGTSGDDLVHIITFSGTTGKDAGTITPNLTDANGKITAPNLIVQRARKSTT